MLRKSVHQSIRCYVATRIGKPAETYPISLQRHINFNAT